MTPRPRPVRTTPLSPPPAPPPRFGPGDRFELRPLERVLLDRGSPCTLRARGFDLLCIAALAFGAAPV